MFRCYLGCVSKKKSKGYSNMNLVFFFLNFVYVGMSLKVTIAFNNPGIPQPGVLLPGNPGLVKVFE